MSRQHSKASLHPHCVTPTAAQSLTNRPCTCTARCSSTRTWQIKGAWDSSRKDRKMDRWLDWPHHLCSDPHESHHGRVERRRRCACEFKFSVTPVAGNSASCRPICRVERSQGLHAMTSALWFEIHTTRDCGSRSVGRWRRNQNTEGHDTDQRGDRTEASAAPTEATTERGVERSRVVRLCSTPRASS